DRHVVSEARVDELRKDPTRGHWVLIRPKGKWPSAGDCPYCPGAEHLTGPEIAAYRKDGSPPNGPGWSVRVVPEAEAYFRIAWERDPDRVRRDAPRAPGGARVLSVQTALSLLRHAPPGDRRRRACRVPHACVRGARAVRGARPARVLDPAAAARLLVRGGTDRRDCARSRAPALGLFSHARHGPRRSGLRDGAPHGAEPPITHITGGLGDDPGRLPLAPRGRRPAGADEPGRRDLRQRGAAGGLGRAPARRLAACRRVAATEKPPFERGLCPRNPSWGRRRRGPSRPPPIELGIEPPHPVPFRDAADALHEGGRPEVRAFLG